jgi:hypothetical protein
LVVCSGDIHLIVVHLQHVSCISVQL